MIKTFCDLSHVIVLLALFAVELREEEVKAPVEGCTIASEQAAAALSQHHFLRVPPISAITGNNFSQASLKMMHFWHGARNNIVV